jgi:ribA/ribD-fused uncharacterized protein
MSSDIRGFFGEYRLFSNFWHVQVVMDGKVYRSTEHAYQAAKTLDPKGREYIAAARSPADARRLGRAVTMRPDWESVKEQVMRDLLIQKFSIDPYKTALLDTGEAYLEETNHWGDVFWGVCNGKGRNRLGIALMEIRADLRSLT